jgi:hypothetical protein
MAATCGGLIGGSIAASISASIGAIRVLPCLG